MKSKLFILVTDNTRGLVVQQGSGLFFLPKESMWPIGLRPKRQNWPLAILGHALYGQKVKLKLIKRTRAFGLPANTAWYSSVVDESEFDNILNYCRTQKKWWFRYANATVPWTIKGVALKDFRTVCDAESAHCAEAHIASQGTKT